MELVPSRVEYVDLAAYAPSLGHEQHQGHTGEPAPCFPCAYLKDFAASVLRSEVAHMQQRCPQMWRAIEDSGRLDLVLQMDNTSYQTFRGATVKLEQLVAKLLFPNSPTAQQSYKFCMPMALLQGDRSTCLPRQGNMFVYMRRQSHNRYSGL